MRIILFIACMAICTQSKAETPTDLDAFARGYFDAWTQSQRPGATTSDLEAYLAFLKDDVGHQHLPHDPDDGRQADGKQRIREGMTYYLGAHTEYAAELRQILTGHQVIILSYVSDARGVHPDTGEEVTIETDMVEILELEDGRVSVIRKYSN